MRFGSSRQAVAKTFAGLEQALADELREIGVEKLRPERRAVAFEADLDLMYRVNLWSRLALRVTIPIFEFNFKTQDEFYNQLLEFDWSTILTVNETFAIDFNVKSDIFHHTQFAALRLKDAIADHFVKHQGSRPSVDRDNPQYLINLRVFRNQATISIDSSGEPLFKRGYRQDTGIAPLNEVLAAGLVTLSGWDASTELFDPMCGSGTIIIEAANMYRHYPPAFMRKDFGFVHWEDHKPEHWEALLQFAGKQIVNRTEIDFFASDINNAALTAAKENIASAGLRKFVKTRKQNFFDSLPPTEEGTIIMNPPYDKRLDLNDAHKFYRKIGDKLRADYKGYDVWILSGNIDALHNIGLIPEKTHHLFNGAIEAEFCHFKIGQGRRVEPTDS